MMILKSSSLLIYLFFGASLVYCTSDIYSTSSVSYDRQYLITGNVSGYSHLDLDLSGTISSLSFSVRSCKDAYIRLEPEHINTNLAASGNSLYGIWLGTHNNRKAKIVEGANDRLLEHRIKRDILHCDEPRSFWISWASGTIKVGTGLSVSKCTELLKHEFGFPVTVGGISVASGHYSIGEWVVKKPHELLSMNTPNLYLYQMLPFDLSDVYFITFKVQCWNNPFVSLQPSQHLITGNAFEIIIGGWEDTKSVIRSSIGGPEVLSKATSHLLDRHSYKQFWVSWEGGVISAGKGETVGEDVIMEYSVPEPVIVKAAAITTGFGATGKWILKNPSI